MIKKVYRRTSKDILEALEDVDKFTEKMELFMKEYPNYSYSMEIKKNKKNWEVLFTVNKDE